MTCNDPMEALCSRLRGLAQDCIDKHLTASAIFYADKLVTFSHDSPGDVYLLAQVCSCCGILCLACFPRLASCLVRSGRAFRAILSMLRVTFGWFSDRWTCCGPCLPAAGLLRRASVPPRAVAPAECRGSGAGRRVHLPSWLLPGRGRRLGGGGGAAR
jgi:hypothetical protein